ncbi:hypothetical protein AB6A40_004589 [Gnathostoma spinigerum]|uniref:Uncharacterized protein n=1 Tax=Gnathostoma spinigerum TaxID=75299 RepID=A0ABD6ENM8_9BILA
MSYKQTDHMQHRTNDRKYKTNEQSIWLAKHPEYAEHFKNPAVIDSLKSFGYLYENGTIDPKLFDFVDKNPFLVEMMLSSLISKNKTQTTNEAPPANSTDKPTETEESSNEHGIRKICSMELENLRKWNENGLLYVAAAKLVFRLSSVAEVSHYIVECIWRNERLFE